MNILSKSEEKAISGYLNAQLQRPVSLELWTRSESPLLRSDRDPCTHCDDALDLARRVASLHSGISLTLYDLEKHADRADDAGIDRSPMTVIRGRGRVLRILGLWAGGLLPAFIDTVVHVAAGTAPLEESTREALAALPDDIAIEVLATPYDPYSVQLMRIACALGVESNRVQVQVTEIAEFPLFAATRGVTEVPVLFANGHRYVGGWEEADLVEQLRRVAAGEHSPVFRDRAPVTPFVTEDEALLAAKSRTRAQPTSPGGLVLPGQS